MLDLMRRHAYSWTTRIVFFFLVLVFAFWGFGDQGSDQLHPLATVNGTPILPAEVDREANQMRQTLQSVYGANAASVLQGMNLRQEALNRIIESRLIDQEARELGIGITNTELEKRITSEPAFLVDGKFDFPTYQETLRAQNYLPAEFEEVMRAQMTNEFMRRMIDEGVQASPEEVRHAYNLQNQRIALAYLEIPYSQFMAKVSPTSEQVAEFYNKGRERFREPERARIVFIHYKPLLLAAQVTPSDKEIESYYKRFLRSRFSYPDRVHARHILVRASDGAATAERDAARAKAEGLLAQVKSGVDFRKLAEKNSDDAATRREGGALGLFGRGQMIKPFEDAVFNMKAGEATIVETEFGFHVVKLDEVQPAHEDTLEQARPIIIEALRADAGAKLAREVLEQDRAAAERGGDLEAIAKTRGLDAVETPRFARGETIAAAPASRRLVEFAFEMEPGQVRTVTDDGNYYLMKLVANEPARIPPLAEIEPKVRDMLARQLAVAEARAQAQKLLEQIKGPDDFTRIASANKINVTKLEPFPRSSRTVPGLGEFSEVTDAAGRLPNVPGLVERVMEHTGNSYIVMVTSRSAPTDEEWTKDEKSFTDEYLSFARAQAWTRFVEGLKARARIEDIDREQLAASSSR